MLLFHILVKSFKFRWSAAHFEVSNSGPESQCVGAHANAMKQRKGLSGEVDSSRYRTMPYDIVHKERPCQMERAQYLIINPD